MSQQSSRICPRCRHESRADDTYCGNCGVALREYEDNQKTVHIRHAHIAPKLDAVIGDILSVFSPGPASSTQRRNRRRTLFFTVLFIMIVGALILGIYLGKGGATSPNKPGNPPGTVVIPTRTLSPTPVTHTYSVSVNASQGLPGMDTGIRLTSGDRLTIKASGEATDGPATDRFHCYGNPINPDGVSRVNGSPCTTTIPSSIYPTAPIGTLLGSINQAGTTSSPGWLVVGSSYSSTVVVSGQLYLIYNDAPQGYFDNNGSYQVTITVERG